MAHVQPLRDDRDPNVRRLGIALGLVVLYMVAEVVGGLIANSLALLADAGHMLSDAASLGLALFAIWIGQRPRTPGHTFGFRRAEILAALVNGVTLVVIAVFIVLEAWRRFGEPREIDGPLMAAIAVGGLFVNITGLFVLRGGHHGSLNVRGAWMHVLTDALGSVQAIVAGVLIWIFDWDWVDPLASILIAIVVLWSAWVLIREAVNVLLEGAPAHLDTREIKHAILEVDDVREIHDLHVWTITSGFVAMSVHVVIGCRASDDLLGRIRKLLRTRFDIEHSTIQIESPGSDGCSP